MKGRHVDGHLQSTSESIFVRKIAFVPRCQHLIHIIFRDEVNECSIEQQDMFSKEPGVSWQFTSCFLLFGLIVHKAREGFVNDHVNELSFYRNY